MVENTYGELCDTSWIIVLYEIIMLRIKLLIRSNIPIHIGWCAPATPSLNYRKYCDCHVESLRNAILVENVIDQSSWHFTIHKKMHRIVNTFLVPACPSIEGWSIHTTCCSEIIFVECRIFLEKLYIDSLFDFLMDISFAK